VEVDFSHQKLVVDGAMERIAVLLTCHNRCSKTLACLDALFQNILLEEYLFEVFLVDDCSTDGTEQAVNERYPQGINITKGNGRLYWNGGMRVAFSAALEKGFDYYLWLNDDTLLYPTAINSLINTADGLRNKQSKNVIVVGSTQDANDGRLTYGGVIRPNKWKTLSFKLITPIDKPIESETMNGNCVLVPNEVAQALGNLEPKFAHAMGDLDYGLRARCAGFAVWVMAGFAGTCANNAATNTFNDISLPAIVRLRKMLKPNGLPPYSWYVFTRRHAGILWPIFWIWPYVKVMLKGLAIK
jgi:GT2 family glycosyltransferase